MVSIGVVVLEVVERVVVPVPWFDDHTTVSLLGGLEEFLASRRLLLVNPVV